MNVPCAGDARRSVAPLFVRRPAIAADLES
jgi:hypothetical protein